MISADDLARYPLFADLSGEQRNRVAALARPRSFPAGCRIFTEGRAADHCWLVRSGRVGLEFALPNGRSRTVQTLGPGDALGWSWLLPPHRWRFDAVAEEALDTIEIDAAPLRALAAADPSLGYPLAMRLAAQLADRLHGTRARLVDLYGSPGGD